jgi:hypothetical protein
MLTGTHKIQRMVSPSVDFVQRNHKNDIEFLNHILRVTDDETWVSFVNVETKGVVKEVVARMFIKGIQK